MVANAHLIDECRLDLAFRSEDDAFEGQARWGAILKDRLLAVADEVFDRFSLPGRILRFERIAVDLGVMARTTGDAEIEARMRERLAAAIRDALARAEADVTDDRTVQRDSVSDFECLRHFLVHGTLPWHGRGGHADDPDRLLAAVLESGSPAFVAWLRVAGASTNVVRRLAAQFDHSGIAAVAAVLWPGRRAYLESLALWLATVFGQAASGSSSRTGRVAWEGLLSALLEEGRVPDDGISFARRAVRHTASVATRDSGSAASVLRAAVAHVRALGIPAVDAGGAFHALRAAVTPGGVKDDSLAGRASARETADASNALRARWKQSRALVEAAIESGEGARLRDLWPGLVREAPWLLAGLVRRHGRATRVRRGIADGFEDAMLADIVCLLEPTHGAFITGMVMDAGARAVGPALPSREPAALRRRLWEFTLTFLLVDRGGVFNRAMYLGSVVSRMAAHENLDRDELVAAMTRVLETENPPGPLHAEMLGILRGLAREKRGGRPAAPDVAIEAVETRDALFVALVRAARGRSGAPDMLARRMQAFARRSPSDWNRLVAEFAVRARRDPSLVDGLGASELTLIILATVRGAPGHAEDGGSEFRQALDQDVRRAPDAQRFLAAVLHDVLRGRPLDLQEIRLRTSVPSARADRMPRGPVGTHAAPRASALRAWAGDASPEPIARSWQVWIRHHPAWLRTQLRALARDDRLRERVAMRATRAMLRDIVHLFAPAHVDFVDGLVHRSDLAESGAGSPVAGGPAFTRRLRVFTLDYLLADRGGRFDRQACVGSIVRRLAAHDNLEVGDFVRALLQRLERTRSPGVLQAELAGILRTLAAAPSPGDAGDAVHTSSRVRARPVGSRSTTSAAGPKAVPAVFDDALAALLDPDTRPGPDARRVLRATLARRLREAPGRLRDDLTRLLEDPRAVRRFVGLLPEAWCVRLYALLRPEDGATSLRAADLLVTAMLLVGASPMRAGPARSSARTLPRPAQLRRWMWEFLCRYLIVEGRRFEPVTFVRAFVVQFSRLWPPAGASGFLASLADALHEAGGPRDAALLPALSRGLVAVAAKPPARGASRDPADGAVPTPATRARDTTAGGEGLHVTNAGQVLASPYLPRLFEMVGLVTDGRFAGPAAAGRAVHLLQYLVDGSLQPPEHRLALNKILCGLAVDDPVARDVTLSDAEKAAVDGLVVGMIRNWTAIGNTSVAGMRESFFQREGRLHTKDGQWRLLVEPRAFDMLLDRIPWGFGTIRHPWMRTVVHVEWR
ncbi:MAG: hypothetical protein GC151_04410 [Betaproteobacteria bacterium]|nr:hypothetical protein [Betaproteobacteria bacterium]